jgi:hypothetical protein
MATWRVIGTDSESLSGVAPACPRANDPTGPHWVFDIGQADMAGVYDCCPHPHLECHSERAAERMAIALTDSDVDPCE